VRLPFFYGWVIIAVAFVTMGVGVNARTAFSLLFPPILDEFGWERGVTAGAFSFGFLISAVLSPSMGKLMDRRGPRVQMELGAVLVAAGLFLAPYVSRPWHLYATLGVLVGGGSVCLAYTGHSFFLPNWFVRQRGLALSIAFSGVGVGSIILLPWLQGLIARGGWRTACATFVGYSKTGSTGGFRRAGSSGTAGNPSAGEPSRAASTRRRSRCFRVSPKSDTCRRADDSGI